MVNDDLDMTDLQYCSFSNVIPKKKYNFGIKFENNYRLLIPSYDIYYYRHSTKPLSHLDPYSKNSHPLETRLNQFSTRQFHRNKIEVACNCGLQIMKNLRRITCHRLATVCRVHLFSVLTFS